MSSEDELLATLDIHGRVGDEYILRCPRPDHIDENPSARVNLAKDAWYCHVCAYGGSLTRLLGRGDLGVPTRIHEQRAHQLVKEIESTTRTYPESWLDQFDHPEGDAFWRGRGLTQKTISRFRLGWDGECAVYPLRDPRGRVLGVVRRRVDGRLPKYRYPKGVSVSKVLFGYAFLDGSEREIALTEGAMDALALWDVGIPAVAQLGSHLSDEQVVWLDKHKFVSVIAAFDMDEAGNKATEAAMIKLTCPVRWACWDPDEGKDPAELTRQRRREVCDNAPLMTVKDRRGVPRVR